MPIAPGPKIGPYEIHSPLGAGGMGGPLAAAQLGAVVLHQRVQGVLAHADAQLEEPLPHRLQTAEQG